MKKIIVLLLMIVAVAMVASQAQAVKLVLGDNMFKFADVSYFDDPIRPAGMPIAPGGHDSGYLWGIAHITTMHAWDPVASTWGAAYWSEGISDGTYLEVVFGGIQLHYDADTGAGTTPWHLQPDNQNSFPHYAYFVDDHVNASETWDHDNDPLTPEIPVVPTEQAGLPYMKFYHDSSYDFGTAKAAGPNPALEGAFGTFGNAIINPANLWLDLEYTPGAIQAAGDPFADADDLLRVEASAIDAGSARAYLDIVGGSAAPSFATGIYPGGADMTFLSDLDALASVGPPFTWTDLHGWTTESEDPIKGNVIPEPATMLLLGSGLIGMAGFARKRKKRSQG